MGSEGRNDKNVKVLLYENGKEGEEERVGLYCTSVRVEDRHEARLSCVWISPFVPCLCFLSPMEMEMEMVDSGPHPNPSCNAHLFFLYHPYGSPWLLAQSLSVNCFLHSQFEPVLPRFLKYVFYSSLK